MEINGNNLSKIFDRARLVVFSLEIPGRFVVWNGACSFAAWQINGDEATIVHSFDKHLVDGSIKRAHNAIQSYFEKASWGE